MTAFEPTLVDLVGVHPITNIQLTQIWNSMLAATYVPFVVQSECEPVQSKKKKSILSPFVVRNT